MEVLLSHASLLLDEPRRMLQCVSGLLQSAILEVPPQAHMGTSDRYIKQTFSHIAMLMKHLESF